MWELPLLILQTENILLTREPLRAENGLTPYTVDNQKNIIFINVRIVLLVILIVAALLIVIFVIRDIVTNYAFISGSRNRKRRKYWNRKKRNRDKGPTFPSSRFDDFNF